jgi:DNA-binding GntR family transcriptional regulator
MLEKESLVVHERGKGWRIAQLTFEDLREIFELKLILEPEAAAIAALNVDDAERVEILRVSEVLCQAAKDGDVEKWLEYDMKFHEILLKATRNERMKTVIDSLNNQWWRIQVGTSAIKDRVENACIEHSRIAECVIEKDVEGAKLNMRVHLENVYDTVKRELRAAYAIFDRI